MPGPAPKPESQVRRPGRTLARGTTVLPASGREGDPPGWPLTRPSKRELGIWERVWATPQATQWEPLGWIDIVARYVRLLAVAEARRAPVRIHAEVRQLEDRLGLSPMAMLRMRWAIADESTESSSDGKVIGIRTRVAAVEA